MKAKVYLLLFLAILFFQCKEEKILTYHNGDALTPNEEIKDNGIVKFSVPSVDSTNIIVGTDFIIINLPENYAGGDYIKPEIQLGKHMTSSSPLLGGFSYGGKNLRLDLESKIRDNKSFKIFVVPFNPVKLEASSQNYIATLGPDSKLTFPFSLLSTTEVIDDSGRVADTPSAMLTNKETKVKSEISFFKQVASSTNAYTLRFPAALEAGEYTVEVKWGTKKVPLTDQLKIQTGERIFSGMNNPKRLVDDKSIEIWGYNFSSKGKYEIFIKNDFFVGSKIHLDYKNAGSLTGKLPENIPAGNYSVSYFENDKAIEIVNTKPYFGDDDLVIRTSDTQPVVNIITQPSKRSFTDTNLDYYYESTTVISRKEPILVHIWRYDAWYDRNDLILINHDTKAEYQLHYAGKNSMSIFDGFMHFMDYDIPESLPNGKYEAYIVIDPKNKTSEKYSRIINIR